MALTVAEAQLRLDIAMQEEDWLSFVYPRDWICSIDDWLSFEWPSTELESASDDDVAMEYELDPRTMYANQEQYFQECGLDMYASLVDESYDAEQEDNW